MRRTPSMGRKLFKGFLKLFKWGFILAVLGVAGLYGYVRYDYVSAANDLDFQIHRARELGIPLSPEEMRPEKVSEDENAAELYRQAASKLEPFKKEMADALTVYSKERHDKPFPSMDTLRPILQKLGPALELARRASLKPHCDFGHDWAKGPDLLFPELAQSKEFVKWLSFRAHLRIREANISLAIQDYQTAGRIASHAGEDPILIAGLVQIALNAITIRSIETAAAEAADATSAKPVLASLRSAATHIPEVPPLSRYFVGEAGMGYEFARNISRFKAELGDAEFSGGEFVGWRTFPPLIETELVERATASRVLRFWNEVLTLNNAVKWEPIRVHAESLLLEQRYVGTWRPLDYLAAILYPVFSHVGLAFEKSKVQRAVTLSMIDVLLFRERQGRLPKSLDEAKITTRDPFGDGPLQYRITKRGFRIYSVGADRKDERGRMYWEKTPAEQAMPSGDDIMAVYPASDRVDPRNAK